MFIEPLDFDEIKEHLTWIKDRTPIVKHDEIEPEDVEEIENGW